MRIINMMNLKHTNTKRVIKIVKKNKKKMNHITFYISMKKIGS
jgi:hypothetical protein